MKPAPDSCALCSRSDSVWVTGSRLQSRRRWQLEEVGPQSRLLTGSWLHRVGVASPLCLLRPLICVRLSSETHSDWNCELEYHHRSHVSNIIGNFSAYITCISPNGLQWQSTAESLRPLLAPEKHSPHRESLHFASFSEPCTRRRRNAPGIPYPRPHPTRSQRDSTKDL